MTPDKLDEIEKQALANCICDDPMVNTRHHCQICTKRYEYWNTTVLRLIRLARSEAVLRKATEIHECECIEPDPINGLMIKEQCNRCEALAESDRLRNGEAP